MAPALFCDNLVHPLSSLFCSCFRLVLYKENNMLLTEQNLSRRRGLVFPQPERMQKVKKSMGAIRQVLGERKRDKISRMALERMQDNEVEVTR